MTSHPSSKIYGRSWSALDNIKQLHEQFRKERRRAWLARSLQLLLLILFFALWEIASKKNGLILYSLALLQAFGISSLINGWTVRFGSTYGRHYLKRSRLHSWNSARSHYRYFPLVDTTSRPRT